MTKPTEDNERTMLNFFPKKFADWVYEKIDKLGVESWGLPTGRLVWLAYLKGRDERPVVVPIKLENAQELGILATHKCPHCGRLEEEFMANYCSKCGAKLDWSKKSDE